MSVAPGDTFGRYQIERLIGEGGMGRVYSARDTRLHRRVALKLLRTERTEGAARDTAAQRLVREARAAAALDHPNVVAVFDAGEESGTPFIAMELVAGRSLRTRVGDPRVPLADKLRWIADVARALDAAHGRGLVHRDVKPSNVIVRDDGLVKVVDFGVARRTVPSSLRGADLEAATLTERGALVGTMPFMSPEQVRGEPADARSDQFSWGVLAYQLLTGSLPWRRGDTPSDTAAAILLQDVGAFADRVSGLPRSVEGTVLRALSKEPAQRFASMREVLTALEPRRVDADVDTATEADADTTPGEPAAPSTSAAPPPGGQPETLTKHTVSLDPTKPTSGRLLGLLALLAVLVAVAVLVPWVERKKRTLAGPPLPSAVGPVHKPVLVTDLELPGTGKPEAVEAYREGLQAFRDGAYATAMARWRQATDADPGLAPAQLRLAIASFYASASAARERFRKAADLRATLSDHDQVLLDAYEPFIARQPVDRAECRARLAAATDRFPGDADFALYRARIDEDFGDASGFARALALDPKFGLVYGFEVQADAYRGKLDLAIATSETCLREVPAAMFCVSQRTDIDKARGDCAGLAGDGRLIIAHDPSLPDGYYHLAAAASAPGGSLDAARQALELAWARLPAGERETAEEQDLYALAILEGRFAEAEAHARKLEQMAASDANRTPHATAARELVEVMTETGRAAEAAKVAADFLGRQAAWIADPRVEDVALAHDTIPVMLHELRKAGVVSGAVFAARRDAWLATWQGVLQPRFLPYLWLHGFAEPAETAGDAAEALARLESFGGPPPYAPSALAPAYVGEVYLGGGRAADAVIELRRATAACSAFDYPYAHTRAFLALGLALERTGDKDAACAALLTVLERWGRATPRSVTADQAASRARDLGCLPRAGAPAAPPVRGPLARASSAPAAAPGPSSSAPPSVVFDQRGIVVTAPNGQQVVIPR